MGLIHQLFDLFFHLDTNLNMWAGMLGGWLYAVLFIILFCETGLVVTPFLPGDSLLFAVGALASIDGSPLSLPLLLGLLAVAAVFGDAVNYAIGARVGPAVFTREDSRWLNKRHLIRTHEFYEKYGGQDDHHRALHAGHPHVCTVRGRRRRDGIHALRDVQRGGRGRLGVPVHHGRLPLRQRAIREAQLSLRDPRPS